MSKRHLADAVLVGAIVLGVGGCRHETQPAATPTAGPSASSPASAPGKPNSSIFLSGALREQCKIDKIESAKAAPKFQFDESSITQEDRDVLGRVAECLVTGPLKGRSVQLVGRADSRGTTDYNMALGARRADAVMKYLGGLGVGAAQMRETSRGELDATGSNEEAFRNDRRVDIDVL